MQRRNYPYFLHAEDATEIQVVAQLEMLKVDYYSEQEDILVAGMIILISAQEDALFHKYPIFYPQKSLSEILEISFSGKWSSSIGYVETMKAIGRAALVEKTLDFDGTNLVFGVGRTNWNPYDIPSRFNKYNLLRSHTLFEMNDFINNSLYLQTYIVLERVNFKRNFDDQMFLERIRLARSISEAEENIRLMLNVCETALKQTSKSCCGLGGIFREYPSEMKRAIKLLEKMQKEIDGYRRSQQKQAANEGLTRKVQ